MSLKKNLTLIAVLLVACFIYSGPAFSAVKVPQIVSGAGREMDRQISEKLGLMDSPGALSIFVTTPANINDLEDANTLARQVQEEISRWFTQKGYRVQEIRKGSEVLFDQDSGEFLMTRDVEKLANMQAEAAAVLMGNYTVTPLNVRFNFRMVHTASLEVIAMSNISIPITMEIAALLHSKAVGLGGIPIEPNVVTRLP